MNHALVSAWAAALAAQGATPVRLLNLGDGEASCKLLLLAQGEKLSPGTLQRLAEQITSGTIGELNAELLKPWLLEAAKQAGVVLSMLEAA